MHKEIEMALTPVSGSQVTIESARRPITVLIADPNEISRSGLRALLEADPRFDLVAEATIEPATLAERSQPNLILLDPARQG